MQPQTRFYQKLLSQKLLLLRKRKRSAKAAAFACMRKLQDSHLPLGIHDTLMLKQCKSYVAVSCVLLSLNAMMSRFVLICKDRRGVSFTFPLSPRV